MDRGDEATALGLLWNTTASHHWVQGSDFSTWSSGTSRKDRGSIVADPQLNTSNFRFAKTSPALTKIGFEPINISKIGPMPNSLYMQELVGKDVLELLARHGKCSVRNDVVGVNQKLKKTHTLGVKNKKKRWKKILFIVN